MRLVLLLSFLAIAAWAGYIAVDAVATGVFVPKSPKYPVLVDENPFLFWIFTSAMFGIAAMMIWLAITTFRDMGSDEPDDTSS